MLVYWVLDDLLGPWIRLASVVALIFVGSFAVFLLETSPTELYYAQTGLILVNLSETGNFGILTVNAIVYIIEIFCSLYCGCKLICFPKPGKANILTTDFASWDTHEGVMLIIAACINSNELSEHFANRTLFVSNYGDDVDLDTAFFWILRVFLLFSRVFMSLAGWAILIKNTLINGTGNCIRTTKWASETIFPSLIVGSIFFSQLLYNIYFFIEFYPSNLRDFYENELGTKLAIEEFRKTEFILEAFTTFSATFMAILLTFYKDNNPANTVATSELFNTYFFGIFGTCTCMTHAFALNLLKDFGKVWIPITIYGSLIIATLSVRAINKNTSLQEILGADAAVFFRIIGTDYSPIASFWRIGSVLGIAAISVAIISVQSQWFLFDISAGALPRDIGNVARVVVDDIGVAGSKAFNVVKLIDPCNWDASKGMPVGFNQEMSYNYGSLRQPSYTKRNISIVDHDISNLGSCQCNNQARGECACDVVTNAQADVSKYRKAKEFIASEHNFAEVFNFSSFEEWNSNASHVTTLEKCHKLECDIVLSVAVAAETTLLAGGAISWLFPPLEEAVSTISWYTELGNRVGHDVSMYGRKAASFVQGLFSRMKKLKPMMTLIYEVESTVFKSSYTFNKSFILVYIPLLLNASISFLLGFYRRAHLENIDRIRAAPVLIFSPLLLLNSVVLITILLFPSILSSICKELPSILFTVIPQEHTGFLALRRAYLLSCISCGCFLTASLLDNIYMTREKLTSIRKIIDILRNRKWARTNGDLDDEDSLILSKEGWYQSAALSSFIPVAFVVILALDVDMFNMQFGPSGNLLKATQSFHNHNIILRDIQDYANIREEHGLCGLVGKAVESIIATAVKELDLLMIGLAEKIEGFASSVESLATIISSFQHMGKLTVHIFEDTWRVLEKIIALGIPLCINLTMFGTGYILQRVTDQELREEISRSIKALISTAIYFHVCMLLMVAQILASINHMDMHVFYFSLSYGPVFYISITAIVFNALSLISLKFNEFFPIT